MTIMNFLATLPDIPRILTAVSEWLACIVCIMAMKRWVERWKLAAISLAALIIQSMFLIFTDGLNGILWNLCMLASFLLMFLFLRLCIKESWMLIAGNCCTAFIVSEFAASVIWQLRCYLYGEEAPDGDIWKQAVLISVYLVIYFVVWRIHKNINTNAENLVISRNEMAVIVLISVIVFIFSNLGFLPLRFPFTGRDSIEIFNMRTVIDLGGVAILYAYWNQLKSLHMKHELDSIQGILNNQYEQYKQAERTIELVNYRYHDLKNHILVLRDDRENPGQSEYLDRLEQEIRDYEVLNKTGNQVLDTLLTSKNLQCTKHKITLTSVVDGSLFAFMDVMDICSIFGNALDNAIESVRKLEDYEKRMIHVDASSEKNFLIIRFENYYEGEIQFERGFPVTTKLRKNMHGYGLKSLKYTVYKYHGEVNIDVDDHWFSLRILIPMKMQQ